MSTIDLTFALASQQIAFHSYSKFVLSSSGGSSSGGIDPSRGTRCGEFNSISFLALSSSDTHTYTLFSYLLSAFWLHLLPILCSIDTTPFFSSFSQFRLLTLDTSTNCTRFGHSTCLIVCVFLLPTLQHNNFLVRRRRRRRQQQQLSCFCQFASKQSKVFLRF